MNEMVERVAQAIAEGWECGWDDPDHRERFKADARAAIAAMREPTEAMIEAGFEACKGRKVTSPEKAKAVGADSYRAMIAQALRE